MASYAEPRERRLPRGWAHFWLQFAIWLGFYAIYQVVRGAADRDPLAPWVHGEWVINFERNIGTLIEPSLQRVVDGSTVLVELTSFTYWLSQFAVVGLSLLWVYFRAHDRFYDFRNTLILANVMGLVGYVLMPTAPPRMFPGAGFVDTLAEHSSVNHESGLISVLANPYAAMPSLHAMDAVIVGVTMAFVVRHRFAKVLWLLWAPWVWFTVMSTGNHYWLDVFAGVLIAGIAAFLLHRTRLRDLLRPRVA